MGVKQDVDGYKIEMVGVKTTEDILIEVEQLKGKVCCFCKEHRNLLTHMNKDGEDIITVCMNCSEKMRLFHTVIENILNSKRHKALNK